jgi:hypothetical protein
MNPSLILKIVAVLWAIWGIVHVFAGAATITFALSGEISTAIGGIADAASGDKLDQSYPNALAGILSQHGFNLLWFGLATLIGSFWVWKQKWLAVGLAALIGGLADLGYFLFLDLGGYVNFIPGTIMTLISGSALILSLIAYRKGGFKTPLPQ